MILRFFALSALFALALAAVPISADEKKTAPPKEGDQVPDVELPATQIEKVLPGKKDAKTMSLKDFQGVKGKNVVLFFFPKAFTGG
jgi:hypothetical protein